MAWERRGKAGPYYYRYVRRGETVQKIYCGRGAAAKRLAAETAERQAARVARWRPILAEMACTRSATQLTNELAGQGLLLFEAYMLSAGFHRRPYGPWRRYGQ
jgi:hypothetical protein